MAEVPQNFKETSEKVYNIVSKTSDVICSTDMYQPNSIKAMERQRRGAGEKFIVQGEMTKKPADWKGFLTNDENKKQLIQIIFKVWSSDPFAPHIGTRKVIFISEGHAYQLQTVDDGSVECRQVLSLLIPSPTDGHGWQLVNGYLEPLWLDGDLYSSLLKISLIRMRMRMHLTMSLMN